MTAISFLFLCAALVPAVLVARTWWLVMQSEDELDADMPVAKPYG